MPIPVDFNSIHRMGAITIPKQDIDFDSCDFHMYAPQSDIRNIFESQELESAFCRDFECCGLILNDLHDLFQHYEECHSCLEEDNENPFDLKVGELWSPTLSVSSASSTSDSAPNSPWLNEDTYSYDFELLKNKTASYFPGLYNGSYITPIKSRSTFEKSRINYNNNIPKEIMPKKRNRDQRIESMPNALDLLAHTTVKKLALVSSLTGNVNPALTDQDFLAQAATLLATIDTNSTNEKPYKCPINGCNKAYKNPNGLKYHNQHGLCNVLNDGSESLIYKPYQCTIGDCGKRYKNLNGLKYHIEHAHMVALYQTLNLFGSTLF
ncbi:hypothetical protein K501DRAFT_141806, partial [Backusella circina FSU 941]